MAEIKSAFKKKVIQYHPDQNKTSDAADKFRAVSDAYGVLKDPVKKLQLDRTRPSTQEPPSRAGYSSHRSSSFYEAGREASNARSDIRGASSFRRYQSSAATGVSQPKATPKTRTDGRTGRWMPPGGGQARTGPSYRSSTSTSSPDESSFSTKGKYYEYAESTTSSESKKDGSMEEIYRQYNQAYSMSQQPRTQPKARASPRRTHERGHGVDYSGTNKFTFEKDEPQYWKTEEWKQKYGAEQERLRRAEAAYRRELYEREQEMLCQQRREAERVGGQTRGSNPTTYRPGGPAAHILGDFGHAFERLVARINQPLSTEKVSGHEKTTHHTNTGRKNAFTINLDTDSAHLGSSNASRSLHRNRGTGLQRLVFFYFGRGTLAAAFTYFGLKLCASLLSPMDILVGVVLLCFFALFRRARIR